MSTHQHLVITYDVSDDTNRRHVRQTLEQYGAWKQYSVCELEVSQTNRVELEEDLQSHIDSGDGDRVRIYRLCNGCQEEITNLGAKTPEEQSNVI